MERWFGPAEMARRLGVSTKALRVYERTGLVRPLRTAKGWRAYGPAEQARLHQVLVLKRLGLSLSRIAELLSGRLASLDSVLALQQTMLEGRRAEMDAALQLLSAARAKLARTGALTPDDLTELTRETTMTDKLSDEQWGQMIQPFVDNHFSPEEQAAFKGRAVSFDQETVTREWNDLIAEGRALQTKGDSASEEAKDLASRWMAQVRRFTGDDPAIIARSAQVNLDALADPEVAPKMPFDASLLRFVSEAYRNAQAS